MALTKANIELFQQLYHNLMSEHKNKGNARNHDRFERIDKYVQKVTDRTIEAIKSDRARKSGKKDILGTTEIPITHIMHETALAYMVGTFLSGTPIFPVVASRDFEDAASMLTALSKRDERRFNWRANLTKFFSDILKYNLGAVETKWAEKRAPGVKVSVDSPGSIDRTPISYEGNEIKVLDPYNLVLDPLVSPSRVTEEGTYAGYIEMKSYINVKRMYEGLNAQHVVKKNTLDVLKSSTERANFFAPDILPDSSVPWNPEDFSRFFPRAAAANDSLKNHHHSGAYEVFTCYMRLIPNEFNYKAPMGGTVHLFKFIFVNGLIIYAEPLALGHEYLPIVIGQAYAQNFDVRSFVEYLFDIQDLATASMHAAIQAMRRSVSDRALYDPTMIRKEDIDSVEPHSKIPVKLGQLAAKGEALSRAYHQIPFEDSVTPMATNFLGMLMGLAEQITGLNQASQGAFVPGNKTLQEFNTIMSNSQARMQLIAMMLESNTLQSIKQILQLNYLINSQEETIDDRQLNSDTPVQIDPTELIRMAPEFAMADGLMPATRIMNTHVLMEMLPVFINNPMLLMEWDIGGILTSVMRQQGLTDVEKYRRTPEEQQAMQQSMAGPATEEGTEE